MEQTKTNDIRKVKNGWYNMVLKEPLKGGENTNIQYIIELKGVYGVASIKPLTIEDINKINLKEWNFRPYKEFMKGNGNNGK